MPVADDVKFGRDVKIFQPDLVNLYGRSIGHESRIGPFAEVQAGAAIGARCKISSHSFICEGVTIEDEAFIGHGVMFTDDKYPHGATQGGRLQESGDWEVVPTRVGRRRRRRRAGAGRPNPKKHRLDYKCAGLRFLY